MNNLNVEEIRKQITEDIYNELRSMVQSRQNNFSMSLENCTEYAQTPFPLKGDAEVARQRMRVCIGYNDDGSPIVKHVSAEGELALGDRICRAILESERRNEFLKDVAEDKAVPVFREYAEYYFNTYKMPKIKPTTAAFYRGMMDKHFYPAWEKIPINRISTQSIQEFLNDRKEMAAKSLREMLTYLRAIFKSAMKDGYIKENPADDDRLMIPSSKKMKREALETSQIREILASLPKLKLQDRRFMALLLFTGMRRGEVLGLRWTDIDFAGETICVLRNVTYPKGQNEPHIGTPKTEHGTREIPLIPMLTELLEPTGEMGFVIGGETPITLSVLRRMLERVERTIDLHGATPHVFRHSFATLLNDAGASIKTIQDVIGDADFSTTANRYVHSRAENRRKAVVDVAGILAS